MDDSYASLCEKPQFSCSINKVRHTFLCQIGVLFSLFCNVQINGSIHLIQFHFFLHVLTFLHGILCVFCKNSKMKGYKSTSFAALGWKNVFLRELYFQPSFTGNINSLVEETRLCLSSIKHTFLVKFFNFRLGQKFVSFVSNLSSYITLPKTKILFLLTLVLSLVSPLQSSVDGQGSPQRR